MTTRQENKVAHGIIYTVVVTGLLVAILVLVGCARERVLRDGTIIREGVDAEDILKAVDGLAERAPEAAMKYLELKLAFQEAKLRELELEQAALAARQEREGVGAEPQIDARLEYVAQQVEAVVGIIEQFKQAKEELNK